MTEIEMNVWECLMVKYPATYNRVTIDRRSQKNSILQKNI